MNDSEATASKVLVIRGGAVGDFILTLPAIRLLREGLPHTSVDVMGYPSIARLAVLSGDADQIHSLERSDMAQLFVPGVELKPALRDFFAGYQLIVSWLYDPDALFHPNLERCGNATVLQGSHQVDPDQDSPAAAQLARTLEQLALFLETPYIRFPKSELDAHPEGPPQIAVHPGSGSPLKNWGYENWARTLALLRDAFPDSSLRIVSGEAEEETIPDFLDLLRQEGVNDYLHEREELSELAGTLTRCQLFLGHDSGISHLAAATGIPCGLLFGPTDPAIWAPQNPGVRVLRKASCSLGEISPEEVLSLASELLSSQNDVKK